MRPPRPHRRLFVVHVVRSLRVGGQETLLCRLVEGLDPARFSCSVVVLQGHAEERGTLHERLVRRGIPVFDMLAPRNGLAASLAPLLASRFAKLGADVVHAHNVQPLLYAGVASMLLPRTRLVATAHGFRDWDGFRLEKPARMLFRRAPIVAVSEPLREGLVARGWSSEQVRLIENGVDVPPTATPAERAAVRSELGVAKDAFVVGAVGRLAEEKAHETLLRAMPTVLRRAPGTALLLAGDGPSRGKLERLSAELGLRQVVRFLGERADVRSLLPAFDVYCLPSRTEGTSISLLEAMAAVVPVVATAVGGTPRVLEQGALGRLVPPGDPEALARALVRAREERGHTGAMALLGRDAVERRFASGRMTAEYADLYAGLFAE